MDVRHLWKAGIVGLAALAASLVPMTVAFAQDETPTPTATPETVEVEVDIEIEVEGDDDAIVSGRWRGVVGVLSIGADGSYSVETRNGTVVSFMLAEDAIVHRPPMGPADASALAEGQRVAVLLQQNEDGSWTAERVLIKPAKPVIQHVSGVIQSIDGTTITVVDGDGAEYTVEVPEGFLARLEVGQTVTVVVADLDGDGALDRTRITARSLVTGEEIRQRLERHAERIRERVERRTDRIEERLEKQMERVQALLERQEERTQQALSRAIERVVEDETKDRLRQAKTEREEAFRAAKARAEEARQQVKDLLDEAKEQLRQRLEEQKDSLDQAREQMRQRLEQQKQEIEDKLRERREQARGTPTPEPAN